MSRSIITSLRMLSSAMSQLERLPLAIKSPLSLTLRSPRTRYYTLLPYSLNSAPIRVMASTSRNGAVEDLTASDPKTLYVPLEDVEPLERYRPGGYHPVHTGDRLYSRYQIVHKLGYSKSSTIWLARDETIATYVAIKISVAETKHLPESDILRFLRDADPLTETHPGKAIVPFLLGDFQIKGPNGLHRCIVTTPARMSIAEAREASYRRIFQPSVARIISAHLIQAVSFLHSRGVVHSDLHEGNILLRLPLHIHNLTPNQLYEKYGQPELEPVKRLDGQPLAKGEPTHGIAPIWLGEKSENITPPGSEIFLADFSESFKPATTIRYRSDIPYVLRAPELFFAPSLPLSFPTDMWALACAIFAILGQRPLFETWFPSDDRIIEEQVDALGSLPPDWLSRWANRGDSFDNNLNRIDGAPRRPLEVRFEYSIQEPRRECGMAGFEEDEKAALFALLKWMLEFKPEDRPSAQQVLESTWMIKWALPELERSRIPSLV